MSTRTDLALAVRRALLASAATAAALAYPTMSVAADGETIDTVIVTGSIIRRTDAETPSPVTVLSAESLEERGVNTIAEAVQRLSANGAGTIQQGWNTGFNFASGANAPALRGLTVQSTLSVADGLRIAPYPLADDGQRNFVDLNTIPQAIIDRIEVLRDGASSTYGADAIAGVINVITKKEIQGLHFNGSAGMSEESDGDENRLDLTWGIGDLASDGYNFYVSGEYQKNDPVWARDRGYPYNTQDWSRKCANGSCLPNLNWNGLTAEDNSFHTALTSIPGVTLIRPVLGTDGTGTGRYTFLNQAAGCRQWAPLNTAAQSPIAPINGCEVNFQSEYFMLQPEVQRQGATMRFTADINDATQIYAMVNYYKTDTFASFTPIGFNGTPTPPNPANLPTANVILPVYVCSSGVGTFNGLNTGCDATNGQLNPYNPYAAQGQRAQVLLRSPYGREVETSSRALRGVVGLDGGFGDNWSYSASLTASEIGLNRTEGNYMIPQRIWDVAAQGSFNFNDPYAATDEAWEYISPDNSKYSPSRLWQFQGTIGKEILDLPGGALAAAAGVSYREESIDAPSGNPANLAAPYSRYYSINAVGTAGERDVKSAFFEISAPVLTMLEFNASGRYDEYSTGQSNFSPKLGFKVTPIEQVAFRGTWSQGFRIPSFNEAFGLPTTGYVTRAVDCDQYAAFCAAHGGPNSSYASGQYSMGLTQTGNPELDPEESESFTAGFVIEPFRNVSFTIDYWQIEVEGLITGVTDTSDVEEQYYLNNGVVNIPGFTAVAGVPDPAFPNALPLLGFVESSFVNQDKQTVAGIDFGANVTVPFGGVTWRSSLELSYLLKHELEADSGDTFRYEGTLSPCNITSCSGAPELRGSWQNSFGFENPLGATTVTLTTYYTDGYNTASLDYGGTVGNCQQNADDHTSTVALVNGLPYNCNQDEQWNVDLTARHQINDTYTVFLDVLNVLDIEPEFDPSAAYGLFGYNPAWGGPNIMGRYFRLGVKIDFE